MKRTPRCEVRGQISEVIRTILPSLDIPKYTLIKLSTGEDMHEEEFKDPKLALSLLLILERHCQEFC